MLGEDTATIFKIFLNANSVQVLKEPLYVYNRGNENSITKTDSYNKLDGVLKIASYCIDDVKKFDIPKPLKRKLCNNFAASYFTILIRAGLLNNHEKNKIICNLSDYSFVMDYSYTKKQRFVKMLVRLTGYNFTIKLLNIRRCVKEVFKRMGQ